MVKHLHLKGFVALAAAFATSMSAFAVTPISDAAGLAAMGNDLAGEYELTADITLTGEWAPIGNNDAPFTGTFNGNGHTIKGLTYTTNGNWVGLFGAVSGTVQNVRLTEANIYGNEHVGILAGRVCNGGKVDNVFTAGYLNGRDHAGGIVGDAGEGEATVSNCLSAAYVIARDYQAGGIVGWSKGTVTISNNIFIGEASCGGWAGVGGIVGFVEDGTTTVKNNVNAARSLKGNAFDATKEDIPKDQRQTRGIVGCVYNDNSIVISSDNLTSDATVIYDRSGNVVDQSNMNPDYNGIITPAADLKKASAYEGLGFGAAWNLNTGNYPVLAGMTLPIAGDYIRTTAVPAVVYVGNKINLAPVSTYGREVKIATNDATVVAVDGTTISFEKEGTATVTLTTEGDAFCAGYTLTFVLNPQGFDGTIATAEDVEKFRENPAGNFKLTADIDMAGVEFKPIQNFTGTLDGQGHFIRNVSYDNKDTDKAAFFATFGGEFIKNVGFEGFNIIGNADVAAVVGETSANGVISNVVVCNSYIQGRDHVASICGKINNDATIVNCLANAQIYTRSYQAAGIVGCGISGLIEKCVFSGTVTGLGGATNLSSIISLLDNNGVSVKNCLGAAAYYTNANKQDGTIVNKYDRECGLENNYITDYSLINGVNVPGGAADSQAGALATAEQVRSKSWCEGTLGLDFTNDWKFLAGSEGSMLPVLAWMNAPLNTEIFNLPNEDGVNLVYIDGTQFWRYEGLIGSWGQGVTVTQTSGEQYATNFPEESAIYAGVEDGSLPAGGGTATFEVGFDSAISDLFKIEGRNTFDVNVSVSGAETVITTVEQFLSIRKNPSGLYKLGADIDLAGVEFNGFCNDGSTAFTGTLDGQGHAVKNFSLKFTGESNKGLFGKTSAAKIMNIAFVGFKIDGGLGGAHHVGLIGQGSAYMENVAIVGHVIGNDHVGLVAGDADGIEMLNCYAVGRVEGSSQVGGYFGCTLEGGCNVENCLSNVEASATYRGWTGGFVGLIDKANSAVTIKNCVSIGNCSTTGSGNPKVTAPFIAGNNAGDTPNAVVTFTGNIYNSVATMDGATEWPTKNETAEGGVVESATAQNPNTLAAQNTYTAIGWDFDNVWAMGTGEYKYPVLATVAVSDFALTGVEDVVAAAPEASVRVAAANGEITVAGLGEASVINVYNAAGVQVASVTVNAPEAVVAAPAAGLYIVAVATDGAVTTAKVVVK